MVDTDKIGLIAIGRGDTRPIDGISVWSSEHAGCALGLSLAGEKCDLGGPWNCP